MKAVQRARPGTTIAIAPGTYEGGLHWSELQGTDSAPIVLAAQDPSRPPVIRGGTTCLHLTDPARAELTSIQFWFLQEAHKLDPSFNPFEGKEQRYRMFDMVCGSDRLRISMMEDFDFSLLEEAWMRDVKNFRERSFKYHLYK